MLEISIFVKQYLKKFGDLRQITVLMSPFTRAF